MARDLKGQLSRSRFAGRDSCLLPAQNNHNKSNETDICDLMVAEVVLPQAEPVYSNTLVTLEMCRGGYVTEVAWPGGNVAVTETGLAGAGGKGVHGLFEAPMPGQQVLVGFIEGNIHNPIVINKYPYNPSQKPEQGTAYDLPLTGFQHGGRDVVLGHYLGSFIALRGELPIPAEIDIISQSEILIEAKTNIEMNTDASFQLTATVEAKVTAGKIKIEDTSGSYKIEIDPNSNSVNIMSGAGGNITVQAGAGANIDVKPGAGAMLNLGNNALNFCNNLPACLFTGAPHSTSIDTKA